MAPVTILERGRRIAGLVLSTLAVVLLLMVMGGAQAQTPKDKAAKPEGAIAEPATREAMYELLSELDDQQVRALLLERMSKEVDKRAAERKELEARSLGAITREYGTALGRYFSEAVERLPSIPGAIAAAASAFALERGDRSIMWFFLSLVVCLLVGAAAAIAGERVARRIDVGAADASASENLPQLLQMAAQNLLARLVPVAAFTGGAGITNLLLNGTFHADYGTVGQIISAAAWTGLAIALVRFALSPTLQEWRECPVARGATNFLVWRVGLVAALFNFGIAFLLWLDSYAASLNQTRLGFWLNLAIHLVLIVSIWQARRGITSIVAGSAAIAQSGKAPLSHWWPWLMMVLFAGHWLVVSILVATGNMPANLFLAMAVTLAVLTILPIIDHALRALVRATLSHPPEASAGLRVAEETTRSGLVRVARVVVAVAISVGLLWLWGVDIVDLAHKGMGARVAGSVINVLLIIGLAYGLWEVVRIVTERQIAVERASLGLDHAADSEQAMEGEGGGAGARLGTILPLVRLGLHITIAVLALLAILGELGINVLPILAGAGVVGLAIGFGAQTLVKDIISGIFFLVDDAFRKGEYIDIGTVKGTVEKISLRSMQLRHHNGPLNTIPFGDIRHVTNFSRDWVIMKLTLRLTYDTDAERVRKLIKKLGQEMAEEPNLKPLFLQPLKSQGVIEMQDSAQIMRVKFMTRPGDQWALRRVVFARIRELFEKEGIRFASREVVVRVENPGGPHELNAEDRAAIGAAAARALETADTANKA